MDDVLYDLDVIKAGENLSLFLNCSKCEVICHDATVRGHIASALPGAMVGLRLRRYTAVESASAQNFFGKLALDNIERTASTSVLFILSATPFCWGVLGTVKS